MKPFLNAKLAGLPRWAWAGLLIGGVGVGLYLHHRSSAETEETGESEELPGPQPQSLESYEGTEAGGGLQGLGVAGPVPQATVPVEAPRIPEGFTEALGGQGETIQSLANGVLEGQQATNDLAQSVIEAPTREIIREQMAGHAPKRKPSHKPPRKQPKQKAKPKPKKKKKH